VVVGTPPRMEMSRGPGGPGAANVVLKLPLGPMEPLRVIEPPTRLIAETTDGGMMNCGEAIWLVRGDAILRCVRLGGSEDANTEAAITVGACWKAADRPGEVVLSLSPYAWGLLRSRVAAWDTVAVAGRVVAQSGAVGQPIGRRGEEGAEAGGTRSGDDAEEVDNSAFCCCPDDHTLVGTVAAATNNPDSPQAGSNRLSRVDKNAGADPGVGTEADDRALSGSGDGDTLASWRPRRSRCTIRQSWPTCATTSACNRASSSVAV